MYDDYNHDINSAPIGALKRNFSPFQEIMTERTTDQQTDQPIDRQTDRPSDRRPTDRVKGNLHFQ